MAETLVDGVRPLSSFTPAEQRLILALVRAEDAPPVEFSAEDLAEVRKVAREAAHETALAVLSARQASRLA